MLDIQIRPVASWPGNETKNPSRSQFKCGYKRTIEDLEAELQKAGAVMSSLVIEMWVEPRMIRLDGKLRADARVQKPGIILRFTRRTANVKTRADGSRYYETQDVSYPCDAFDGWAMKAAADSRVETLPSAEGSASRLIISSYLKTPYRSTRRSDSIERAIARRLSCQCTPASQ